MQRAIFISLLITALVGCWADGIDPPQDSREIFVEGSAFHMGSEAGNISEGYCFNDRAIRRCVVVQSFAMDETEVTNLQYRHCVARDLCEEQEFTNAGAFSDYRDNPRFDHYPAVHVTWAQAQAYCEFRGKRLPTEAEWEFAAKSRGQHPDIQGGHPNYTWGNQVPDDSCTHANIQNCSMRILGHMEGSPVAVKSDPFAKDVTAQGIRNLTGNVQEWVQDWYSAKAYCGPDPGPGEPDPCAEPNNDRCYRDCEAQRFGEIFCRKPLPDTVFVDPAQGMPDSLNHRVARGGFFGERILADVHTGARHHYLPSYKDSRLGFRCVRDLGEAGDPCLIGAHCISGSCTSEGTCTAWTMPTACAPDPGPSALVSN